jgi:signal peptidase I
MGMFEHFGRDLRDTLSRLLREYSESLIFAIILAWILRSLVFGAYKISNPTMEPNLAVGDYVIGFRLPFVANSWGEPFRRRIPKHGDVVVLRCPQDESIHCIKRVVGRPGDLVEMQNGKLLVNGKTANYEAGSSKPSNTVDQLVSLIPVREQLLGMNHEIFIHSVPIPEKMKFPSVIVPPNSVFLLADNRDFATDSRLWGPVSIDKIEAKATWIWLSIDWFHTTDDGPSKRKLRFDRILRAVR